MGLLDGRVALVTGAGRGIGREHALLLADEGASVVVNDLGVAGDGSGRDRGPAHEVVSEITAAGGRAVANLDDVTDWAGAQRLVQQAVSELGHLDVVINNAGILRDAFVASLEEDVVDSVLSVHLKGHLAVLHHAAAYWRDEAKAGRSRRASVINTSSIAGTTWTNPGQAVYGAAKAGIAAMSAIAAAELGRYGVRVNAIAPVARTRMTLATPGVREVFASDVPAGEFDRLGPENIAPLVAYLASAGCPHTGETFAVQGGEISRLEGWRSVDTVTSQQPWAPADLASVLAGWNALTTP